MLIRKQRLMTPGPTPLLPAALHAMMGSDIHHRTDDFRAIYKQVIADLKTVMGTSNDVLLFTASGTGAMDASVCNLFCPGDTVVVCSAGKFGERWVEIAKAYGLSPVVVSAKYGDAVKPEQVQEALKQNPNARGVFVQASETSTGAAHDMEAIGRITAKTAAVLVVDAITGLGTMRLDIEEWGLDVVIGGSQKAFMIPPGLAFMSVSDKAWMLAERSTLPHFYFDLKRERESAAAGEATWTPSTSVVLAFAEALKYVKQIGMAQLIANAEALAKATRAAVRALGLELFSPNSPCSAVTAVKAPKGINSGVIVREFRNRFGSVIVNGQGSMKGQIFRLAHLGYFDFSDLFAVIAQLEIILALIGIPVAFGSGVAELQRVYMETAVGAPETISV